MDKNERFLEVLGCLGIGAYDLEKKGVKNAQAKVSHYRNGVTKGISSDIIISLCTLYPNVNANYILTGNGSMFISEQEMASNEIQAESGQLIKQLNYRINELEKELEEERKKNRAKKGTS